MAKRSVGEGTEIKFNERLDRWEQRFGYKEQKTGKQKVKAIYGMSRQEVVQKAKAWQKEQSAGLDTNRSKMTFEAWLKLWLSTYKANHIEKTSLVSYRQQINNHIVPELGSLKLRDITRQGLQEFINKKRSDLAPASLSLIRAILSNSLKAATEEDILLKNPAAGLKIPGNKAADKEEVKPYTKEELAAILKEATGTIVANIVILAARTGMRRGELCGLRWSDVDQKGKIIHVRQQLKYIRAIEDDPAQVVAGALKTKNARRDIPFDARVLAVLKKQKAWQSKNNLAADAYVKSDLVFTDELGRPINPKNLSNYFRGVADRAGLTGAFFHNLRHTFASVAISAGVNIKAVSMTLGHAGIQETLDTYGHLLPGDSSAVTSAVSAYFAGVL